MLVGNLTLARSLKNVARQLLELKTASSASLLMALLLSKLQLWPTLMWKNSRRWLPLLRPQKLDNVECFTRIVNLKKPKII